jgi:hypothetical protein
MLQQGPEFSWLVAALPGQARVSAKCGLVWLAMVE